MSEQAQQNGAVVVARDVTRRYGEGDTAVDALRGVTVEIAPGKATAVMGPSGSGKSTLMHILAGLDKPTYGQRRDRRHGDHDARRQRPDEAPPRAHRLRLPVLQPAADAGREGEHPPSAHDRRGEAGDGLVRPGRLGRRSRRPALASPVRALGRPAAAGRDRARAHLEADRPLRGRADREPRLADRRPRSSSSCAARWTSTARRSSWSRTMRAPRRGRTGCSSSPTARSCARWASATSTGSWRSWKRSPPRDQGRPPRPRGAQAPRGPDGHRDRPRRRDDQRHLHPHGHDRPRVQDPLHGVVRRNRRGRHGSRARHLDRRRAASEPAGRRLRCSRPFGASTGSRSRPARSSTSRTRRSSRPKERPRAPRARRRSASASTPTPRSVSSTR